ncbi:prohibitin family protein [Desulfonema magnum]|uniref:prohibitin family protein n=1 Tax=Desulfonema magnum TaxID=45655 RepID=UPI001A9B4821|nr:prohibitin family protein [Desulfonema magnum]
MKFYKKIITKLKAGAIPLLIFFLMVLIIISYLSKRTFYSIMPGEGGVHWSRFHGTEIDYVYPEGLHTIYPWDKMYIYNVRIQEIAPEFDVLTNTGLRIHLLISIRYAPKYKLLGVLHQKVGPDYVNTVIIPEIEAVLREIIGTMGAEEIYTTGRAVIIEAINQAIEQVAQRYINVDDVLIKRIDLPNTVAKAIQYKIEQKHLVEAHKFIVEREKKEADRKRIEGEGIRDQLKIIASALPEGEILKWKGIQATESISKSDNAKVVIVGNGPEGLPIILNTDK